MAMYGSYKTLSGSLTPAGFSAAVYKNGEQPPIKDRIMLIEWLNNVNYLTYHRVHFIFVSSSYFYSAESAIHPKRTKRQILYRML